MQLYRLFLDVLDEYKNETGRLFSIQYSKSVVSRLPTAWLYAWWPCLSTF